MVETKVVAGSQQQTIYISTGILTPFPSNFVTIFNWISGEIEEIFDYNREEDYERLKCFGLQSQTDPLVPFQ